MSQVVNPQRFDIIPTGVRMFRITGVFISGPRDQHDNPVQWFYHVDEMEPGGRGYDRNSWHHVPGLFSPARGQAYNFYEWNNGQSQIQGNGIDHGSEFYSQTGFSLRPVPEGTLVPGILRYAPVIDGTGAHTDTVEECWFWAPNGEDGQCERAGSSSSSGFSFEVPIALGR